MEYGSLVRHYFCARGIAIAIREGHYGSGLGVTAAKAKWLENELERIEVPLRQLSPAGFSCLKMLCVHERTIDVQSEAAAIVVLVELGALLRKVGRAR